MTNKQERGTDGFNSDGCLERDGLQGTCQIFAFYDRMVFFIGMKGNWEYISLNLCFFLLRTKAENTIQEHLKFVPWACTLPVLPDQIGLLSYLSGPVLRETCILIFETSEFFRYEGRIKNYENEFLFQSFNE